MSDISRWHELVQPVKLRCRDHFTGEWQNWKNDTPLFSEYIQVPLNEYQMGHIAGMLARVPANGDWWDELLCILIVAMDKSGLEKLTNNFGDSFTLEELRARKLEIKNEDS